MSFYISKYKYKREKIRYKKYTITKNNINKIAKIIMEWCLKANQDSSCNVTERSMHGIHEAKDSFWLVNEIEAEVKTYNEEYIYDWNTNKRVKSIKYNNPYICIESPVRMSLDIGTNVYINKNYLIYGEGLYKYGFTNRYDYKKYDIK